MVARFLTRLIPQAISTRLARHALPVAVGLIGTLLLVGIGATALLSPGTLGVNAARITEERDLGNPVAGLSERDSDNDGVSDSLENYVYGTDPDNWDSASIGIPDGWLVQYRFDPLDPLTRTAHGRPPPLDALPAAYADGYPAAYTPTLTEYYNYAKPRDHQPGVDAPWWRVPGAEHADPVAQDQTGTGIPTGWIIHHGLSLANFDPERVAAGSQSNLTIRQAWEHNTDPMERDSDKDGLDDQAEIDITKTDPSAFSTAGVGIADGWLLRYGLNAFNPDIATQDPDRDGLTNFEEFDTSLRAFASAVNESGISALYTRGLNPLEWQTAGTGIPDGWYVRYGLSPFGADVDRVIGRASDFAEYRTYAPEGQPALADITFTVRGAYEYARPDDWNESSKGVWWGGTNPVTLDSDNDGLSDPIEIRGWYANVTFDTGPEAKPRVYLATSNPLEPDSDGDGLNDREEYRGVTDCGMTAAQRGADAPAGASSTTDRTFPSTDPRNRDTAFSGLSDYEKVCGAVRGEAKYDIGPKANVAGLDPTRADSAGDHIKDGARLDYWHERGAAYKANPRYPFNQSAYRTVFEWTEEYARFSGLSRDQTVAQFRPDGDVDNDGIMNVADADPSGGLYAEKFAEPGTPRNKVFFLGGPQISPEAYRLTEFASPIPHSATDPANPDTDGDGLPDQWETRYGRFDPAINRWNLDPARSDSDGDGIPDDKANNDLDTVTWYSHDRRGDSTERTARTFTFTNDLEFLAGTDPNEVSTSQDGVPDGWKAFWGSRITSATYPNLLGSRDASIGGVALARAGEIEAALAQATITPTTPLKGIGSKTTGYVRLVNVSACSATLEGVLASGETKAAVNGCFEGTNLDNQLLKVARIQGVKKLTYADESRLRTNPYMEDTDGDGAPDAYEAHYLIRSPGGNAHPDPVIDDSAKDPDADGLGIKDECASIDGKTCGFERFTIEGIEYGAGADPNLGDTDGDGIQDGIEAAALINPLDPSDVESFARADQDTDQDGLPDFIELTGKDSRSFFGELVRTNPKDADSDNDGALDGNTRTLNPAIPADASLIAAWTARGIAHVTKDDGRVSFLGEREYGAQTPFGLRPDRLDSAEPGIPDGWVAYYNQDPDNGGVDADAYAAHRPAWWIEAIHGVWWWGEDPTLIAVPPDADADGLNDANGEDPFPGTNRLNRIVDGNRTISDPREIESWVKAGGALDGQRARAQRVGDGAGEPKKARSDALNAVDPQNVYQRNLRACVSVLDVAAPAIVNKGEAFNLTGRVVLNERNSGTCGTGNGSLLEGDDAKRVGLANRTVLVSVFTPHVERVVGAGFTNATGAFNLSVNITASQRFEIPAPGIALLGSVSGIATTTFEPSQLSTGVSTGNEQNRLVVWVYNTSATAPTTHPTYAPHSARVVDKNGVVATRTVNATGCFPAPCASMSAAIPVTVRSATDVEFTLAGSIVNGQKLIGDLRLVDASGAPLTDRAVFLKWTGSVSPIEFRNLSTDRNGIINVTNLGIAASVRDAEVHSLIATFASTDPNLLPVERTLAVSVLEPTAFLANTDRDAVTVGEGLSISGEIVRTPVVLADGTTLPGAPIRSATVTATLGSATESATADTNGRFTVRLSVPGSLSAGEQRVTLKFAGTDTAAPAEKGLDIDVKRMAELTGLTRLEGPRNIDVGLRGRLVDNEGQGFSGPVEVYGAKVGLLARGTADNNGLFLIAVPLGALDLGTQSLRIAYPGDLNYAPAENLTTARVTSLSRIDITGVPDVLVRGTTLTIGARLLDDKDAPIPQQAITVYWRGVKQEVRVTDSDGRVSFLVPTNASERAAITSIGLEFTPIANSVYQPTTASKEVRVVAGVSLTLEPSSVARGPVGFRGRLLDDEGRPLPGSGISLTLDGVFLGEARASRNGSFELMHVLPDDFALGAHRVSARYPGAVGLSNMTVNETWHVRSPLLLELTTVGPLIRGENAPIEGKLVDDRGKPVEAPLRVFLAGRDLGDSRTTNGNLRMQALIPAEIPRGETEMRIIAPQTDTHDALEHKLPVIVKIRPKVEVELPALAVRGFAVGGGVTLLDDKGEPLRNTSFAYKIGNGASAVTGVTNTDGDGAVVGVAPLSGDATLALTVRGGADVVAAQYTSTSMRVVGPATPIGYAVLFIVLLVVLLIVGLVIAAVLLRRRQLQEARDIIDEAMRDLLAGNEYAGTIFLAYRRFTAYLSRHGFSEKASDTPREFASGVRKALPIGSLPLRALIGLFEEARYSDHAIGSSERDRAVESLATVRNELDKVLGKKKVSA